MTRRKVDKSLIDEVFALREQGVSIVEILSATGLSQGAYYAYVHRREAEIEQRYLGEMIEPLLTWPGSKRRELKLIMPHVPKFDGRYV